MRVIKKEFPIRSLIDLVLEPHPDGIRSLYVVHLPSVESVELKVTVSERTIKVQCFDFLPKELVEELKRVLEQLEEAGTWLYGYKGSFAVRLEVYDVPYSYKTPTDEIPACLRTLV